MIAIFLSCCHGSQGHGDACKLRPLYGDAVVNGTLQDPSAAVRPFAALVPPQHPLAACGEGRRGVAHDQQL